MDSTVRGTETFFEAELKRLKTEQDGVNESVKKLRETVTSLKQDLHQAINNEEVLLKQIHDKPTRCTCDQMLRACLQAAHVPERILNCMAGHHCI